MTVVTRNNMVTMKSLTRDRRASATDTIALMRKTSLNFSSVECLDRRSQWVQAEACIDRCRFCIDRRPKPPMNLRGRRGAGTGAAVVLNDPAVTPDRASAILGPHGAIQLTPKLHAADIKGR
ncbi:hypothetical protein BRAS3843_2650026 [Bradyrhizobium sp. STM 3843]|nr:hypothetical protein BRAS3843_2650026 [Bradyrhizobium sp. STM 3843]